MLQSDRTFEAWSITLPSSDSKISSLGLQRTNSIGNLLETELPTTILMASTLVALAIYTTPYLVRSAFSYSADLTIRVVGCALKHGWDCIVYQHYNQLTDAKKKKYDDYDELTIPCNLITSEVQSMERDSLSMESMIEVIPYEEEKCLCSGIRMPVEIENSIDMCPYCLHRLQMKHDDDKGLEPLITVLKDNISKGSSVNSNSSRPSLMTINSHSHSMDDIDIYMIASAIKFQNTIEVLKRSYSLSDLKVDVISIGSNESSMSNFSSIDNISVVSEWSWESINDQQSSFINLVSNI